MAARGDKSHGTDLATVKQNKKRDDECTIQMITFKHVPQLLLMCGTLLHMYMYQCNSCKLSIFFLGGGKGGGHLYELKI